MSKPPGIALRIGLDGLPSMSVRHSTRAEDAIWDAVEEALNYNMSADEFIAEARAAWAEAMKNRARWDDMTFAEARHK